MWRTFAVWLLPFALGLALWQPLAQGQPPPPPPTPPPPTAGTPTPGQPVPAPGAVPADSDRNTVLTGAIAFLLTLAVMTVVCMPSRKG